MLDGVEGYPPTQSSGVLDLFTNELGTSRNEAHIDSDGILQGIQNAKRSDLVRLPPATFLPPGSSENVVQHSFNFASPSAPPYPTLQVTPTRFNLVFGQVMLYSILDIKENVDPR
ncbi:hypothetical protein H310_08746 [Aphanomyces invadans]|uniref:Uncharacterized protein n=1 Tax=Aphanomyces invadans TaxID=157072 RepID=A0A024TWT1_9STRA|nr:hypothetical protein H310_08746 [Aphanomyces invadans]ETV98630.1 hypothetical protein H310_08746 [Aphanomyces invadans]|eukprot:XP_008872827.1 hypothetical protein H310_08746 [Aphanomyces invadans]